MRVTTSFPMCSEEKVFVSSLGTLVSSERRTVSDMILTNSSCCLPNLHHFCQVFHGVCQIGQTWLILWGQREWDTQDVDFQR